MRLYSLALLLTVLVACESADKDKSPEPTPQAETRGQAAGEGSASEAPSKNAGSITVTLDERAVNFDVAPGAENYVLGSSFHLLANTKDGERFEILGKNAMPETFPADLKLSGDASAVLRYSNGPTEWSDEAPTIHIDSFSDNVIKGTFASEMLRPNKPANPMKLSNGSFELRVAVRLR